MMVHKKRSVFVNGNWTFADLKHDVVVSRKEKVYLHYIPGANGNRNGVCYQLNGPYVNAGSSCNYEAVARECIRRDGIATVLSRAPTRARKIILRVAEELIKESSSERRVD